ncbi:N-acetylgalactosamine-N,N'-diacetylbacillosaminyl-diphospho-undecaprenol 4-alpha-N-acetylgalactosaminyltransferase [Campylobacter volucris]|uniref:N-acetylgalactosamine-N, N'-diacetylbacillosaminyl-diphospho-undecaprenol 4-alpha-N-acetylgalactosaminyltransferase n=1 Tax=Campylobacter volucris TaxID=1031542 RepID=UPI0010597DD4|nr:glycosyltransferase [Campylobacter volucris]TDJ80272.1 glycosyltransferase [Campylobacter volucris]
MKKLAIFIYSLGSGGAERVVSTLLPMLNLKYEVHLILMNDKISYDIPQVSIHYLEKSSPNESNLAKFLKLPLLALKYKKLCENLDINLQFILLNRPNYIALMAKMLGLKSTLIINECTTPSVIYKHNNLNSFINKFLIKNLYNKADLILANSLGNKEDLLQNFNIQADKCDILYNAIDLESISEKSKEQIPFKDPFILSVGRLDSGKNHAMLIRAYAKVQTNLKLVILGEGILKNELLNLIEELNLKDKVFLLGFDNNPYKYMSKCDFFAFASSFEGFSNVLIECLACNCAVLCTDHKSGARELFLDDEFGLLVKVDDQDAMQKGLEKMCFDENLKQQYRQKAFTRAQEFDKVQIAKKLFEFFNEVHG